MADVVSPEVRSQMMAGIRGKNTSPEMTIRRGLHAKGFRYILHDKRLPGKPDLVLPKYRAVIFIHGCFWHGHNCNLFRWPTTREKFWKAKIIGNRFRDKTAVTSLLAAKWRICTVWECSLKNKSREKHQKIFNQLATWIKSGRRNFELRG